MPNHHCGPFDSLFLFPYFCKAPCHWLLDCLLPFLRNFLLIHLPFPHLCHLCCKEAAQFCLIPGQMKIISSSMGWWFSTSQWVSLYGSSVQLSLTSITLWIQRPHNKVLLTSLRAHIQWECPALNLLSPASAQFFFLPSQELYALIVSSTSVVFCLYASLPSAFLKSA